MPATADERVIAAFTDYLKVEKGLAPLSVAAYTRDLKQFQIFLASKRRTLLDCRRDDVRAFLQVNDTLWVATTAGLSSFARGSWQNRTSALSLSTTSFALHADTLWAATSLGPYRYESGVFQPRNSGHSFPSQVLVESSLGFFSGSAAQGAYRYAAGAWQSLSAGLPTPFLVALRDGPDGAL